MARFDFCGGSYTSQLVNANAQKCLNLYPEVDESQEGRSKMTLLGTPGLLSIATLDGPPRAQLEYNGRLFVIAGTKFYEITLTSFGFPLVVGTTVIGTVANDGLPASIAANEIQILMCSAGKSYLFTFATSAFVSVDPSNGANSFIIQVAFSSSFFLALIANSQTVCISNVLDGSNWNLNGQIVVSSYPENVVSMIVDHQEVGLIGRKKSVTYLATGSANVFDVNPSGFIEQGGIAVFGASQLDNSVFWVGGDERGSAIGWRLNGYTPVRITTHPVELAWQSYPKRSDAVSYSYQDQGHSFWQVLFPSANNGNGATWDYDTATGLWHERDFLNVMTGASMGHPSWNHSFWNGAHIVGDWRSANLYQMSLGFFDNAGTPITRLRRAPHISTELETIRHSRFILDMETGLGPEPPLLEGGTYQGTQINVASGGVTSLPASFDGGVTTNLVNYLVTVLVQNNGPNPIFINVGTLAAHVSVPAGAIQQVSIPLVGDGVTHVFLRFETNGTDNLSVVAYNPIILNLTTNTNIIPLADRIFVVGWTYLGTQTLLQNQPTPGSIARAPRVYLRWSDDGGHTWSNLQPRDAGFAGQYRTRVRWARLGRARVRTYEVSCSDPIPVRFVDAYVNASPGYQPSERMNKQLQKVA